MKFGRKTRAVDVAAQEAEEAKAREAKEPAVGPFDVADVDLENDGVERVDLGGILVAPSEGMELRLQVEEKTGDVQSILIVGPTGAVDVRAFAAQRNVELWPEVRQTIAAETSQRGGTATEREGRHGPELLCEATVQAPDGSTQRQSSRIAGIDGPRWLLRATFLGNPAVNPDEAGPWEDAVERIVVRRGTTPMAPGEPLPIELPPQAQRVSEPVT